jgi:uncharacterized membrane protein YgaE (UPF0421/DUF939 family)
MTNLSALARTIILIISVAVAALMAPDVFNVLPRWAQVLVGVVAAVVAALTVPPGTVNTREPAPPAPPAPPAQ